eukprot:TRINITY_DN30449_c0_g1_i1.p1 TRINITY_DN30449_c0_g1~~TRINITY_DN30449_c0_g1_i1.p1  ORF type:complete len:125 (+),score=25.75 TRINITY_DN30449_c0_g1_i1:39-413(+)
MGLFGGAPESSAPASKLRPYSSGDGESLSDGSFSSGLDFSSSGNSSLNSGDFQTNLAVAQQSAQLMNQIHHLNETCWDICITGKFSSSLGSRDETCLTNCVDRFLDTTLLITNRFAQLAQKMGR